MRADVRLHLFPAAVEIGSPLPGRWLLGAALGDPEAGVFPSYAKAEAYAREWLGSAGGGTLVVYDSHGLEASAQAVAAGEEPAVRSRAEHRSRPSALAERAASSRPELV